MALVGSLLHNCGDLGDDVVGWGLAVNMLTPMILNLYFLYKLPDTQKDCFGYKNKFHGVSGVKIVKLVFI